MRSTMRETLLEELRQLGYGNTRQEVEDYLIARALDDLVRAGVINPRQPRQ